MTDTASSPAGPHEQLYGGTDIDPARLPALIGDLLSGTDDGELFVQNAVTESFAFDDGRLKSANYDHMRGFGLRGLAGEKTGFAHSNVMSEAAIRRAGETVGLAAKGHDAVAAPPPARTNRHLYGLDNPLEATPFRQKVELLERIDAAARARDPRVRQVSISMVSSHSAVEIVRADGFRAADVRPLVRMNVEVVTEVNGRRERGYFGHGGRYDLERLMDEEAWNRAIDEALRQSLVNQESVDAPAGQMNVVLGSGWCGVLLHEAVGHGLEGDFNRKGQSTFSGRIGEQVAAKGVTVVDQGNLPERRGSLSIDDEGTPTSETVLIEDGVLKGYMQDRLNARLMGAAPTGNGRRESYGHSPMPRMTNTFMRAGGDDPEEIIQRAGTGIYTKSFGGGQVDITSGKFVFSCTEAYLIEDGKLGAPIKGATLIGSGPEVMQRVKAIGTDFALDEGIGVCGKGGQSVPAGVGQPTMFAEGLTVGGTAA
ncbi:metalloprotease TldD [Pacificimonas flava]|uniref:Metalloprotease TldD n=2 Tax=Pacificimonas TaxID=1960290 RepID=A0A219B1Z3_9SPHN|nr:MULTISPECIES: metalloprotease TldD [Pacificimonas]MBZ6377993.1 metalloprotease TldD [Pacificimonas aurantium]OWV32361.1 metalloprotease TldD [Pacificimonas flava]